MGKSYDYTVTPQNTPRFRQRRWLFLLGMGCFLLNALLMAIVSQQNWKVILLLAGWGLVFTAAQYFDRRKNVWTWGYVISICVVFILITAVMAAFGGLWWMAGVALTELCGFSILAVRMVKGKNRKNKKRGERYGNQK